MSEVFEAFTPSGTEAPDTPEGLFTGDRLAIQQFVAMRSTHWRADQVRVQLRTVKHVDAAAVKEFEDALTAEKEAKQRLRNITGERG
jgi:hypothetical protein